MATAVKVKLPDKAVPSTIYVPQPPRIVLDLSLEEAAQLQSLLKWHLGVAAYDIGLALCSALDPAAGALSPNQGTNTPPKQAEKQWTDAEQIRAKNAFLGGTLSGVPTHSGYGEPESAGR